MLDNTTNVQEVFNKQTKLIEEYLSQDPDRLNKSRGFYNNRLRTELQRLVGVLSTYKLYPVTVDGIDGSINFRQLSAFEEDIVIDQMVQDYINNNLLNIDLSNDGLNTSNAINISNRNKAKQGSTEYTNLFNQYYHGSVGIRLRMCAILELTTTESVQNRTRPKFTMDQLYNHISAPVVNALWRQYELLQDNFRLSIGEENLDETVQRYLDELSYLFLSPNNEMTEEDRLKKSFALLIGTSSYITSAIAIRLYQMMIDQEVFIQGLRSSEDLEIK